MLIPVEQGRERMTEKCIAGFPTSIKAIRYSFSGPLAPERLRQALLESGAEGFFSCRPRVVLGTEAMAMVRRHTRRSVFWYLEGASTFEEERAELGHLGLFSEGFAVSRGVARAIEACGPRCRFLPGAVDAAALEAPPLRSSQARQKLGFVGVPKRARIEIINHLIGAGLPVEVVGPGWGRYVDPSRVVAEGLWDAQCTEYYRSVQVALNIDEWYPVSTSGLGLRPFEVLLAGVGCLTNPSDELQACFGTVPSAFEVWTDETSLVKAAKAWLDGPVRRWDTHALLAAHTFQVRMAEVATALQGG